MLLILAEGVGFEPLWAGAQTVFKTALVDFLTDDFAFEIFHKSTWHMNTILLFVEKE